MFNDESTHVQRQALLQGLMARGTAEVGSGVHGPAEINRLLARSDAEFRAFQQVRAPACTMPPSLTLLSSPVLLGPGAVRVTFRLA